MDSLEQLTKDVEVIKKRNGRVEMDKAWETSLSRKTLVLVITYIVASLVMYAIGVSDPHINSLIPTIGFFLSTLTFAFVKNWWIAKHFTNQQ